MRPELSNFCPLVGSSGMEGAAGAAPQAPPPALAGGAEPQLPALTRPLEGGGPHPEVPLDMAVSPGRGAPPRSPPPGGSVQPVTAGVNCSLERPLLAPQFSTAAEG